MTSEHAIRIDREAADARLTAVPEVIDRKLLHAARHMLVGLEGNHVETEVAKLDYEAVEGRITGHIDQFAQAQGVESPSKQRRTEFAARRLIEHLRGASDGEIRDKYDAKVNIKKERDELLKGVSSHIGSKAVVSLRSESGPKVVPTIAEAVTGFGRRHGMSRDESDALISWLEETADLTRQTVAALNCLGGSYASFAREQPQVLTDLERSVLSGITGRSADDEERSRRKPLTLLAVEMEQELKEAKLTAPAVVAAAIGKLTKGSVAKP